MADHTYKFDVAMSCGGCSGAIERVLKRLEGMSISAFEKRAWSLIDVAALALPRCMFLLVDSSPSGSVGREEVDGYTDSVHF